MYTKKSPGLMIFLIAVTVFLLNAPSAIAGKNPIVKHVEDAIIENLDLTPGNDERATITFPLRKGINYDGSAETGVWFILTDISDEALADRMGIAFAGVLKDTSSAATSQATLSDDLNGIGGTWEFEGNLPNNVSSGGEEGVFNDYSPLREVTIGGKKVVVNAIFVKWGDGEGEQLRIDETCTAFPDKPEDLPNSTCQYRGAKPGDSKESGQVLAIDTDSLSPSVTFKLHKAWYTNEYLPYYIVTDAYPKGPAMGMGVPYVPKYKFIGTAAGPLVQSLPPGHPQGGNNFSGGGPLGGQIGLPSYFKPGNDYTPLWHIGFIKWNVPQLFEILSLDEAFDLQAKGFLGIFEFNPPPPPIGSEDGLIPFDPKNPTPPHVVNCPVPMTVDVPLL